MSVSRRVFVGKAVLAGIAAQVGLSGASTSAFAFVSPQKPDDPAFLPTSSLSRATFAALVNTTFRIRYRSGFSRNLWIATTLTRIVDFPVSPEQLAHGGECFSLVLQSSSRSGRTSDLEQGTYQVDNSTMGTFALFLKPSSADAAGNRSYEAVFNHAGTMVPTRLR